MGQKQLFRTAILDSDFPQDPDKDPRGPDRVAGWCVQELTIFPIESRPDWTLFDNYEQAEEYAVYLLENCWHDDQRDSIKVYPLYAGEGIVIRKQDSPATKPASV